MSISQILFKKIYLPSRYFIIWTWVLGKEYNDTVEIVYEKT